MSRLSDLRQRLAELRASVARIMDDIRNDNIRDFDQLELELLALRDDESDLVAEIAYLESAGGEDDGSAGALVPRRPRPLPMSGAAAAPIPIEDDLLVRLG